MPASPPSAALRRVLPWAAAPQRRRIATQLETAADLAPPMGGIGAGTLSLGANGGLAQTALAPWAPRLAHWPGAGVSVFAGGAGARALMPAERAAPGWAADPAGSHHALYPKGWHCHTHGALAVTVEQVSPVYPGGEDIDLPVALLRVHLRNESGAPCTAAAMVCLPNLLGHAGAGHVPEGQHATPFAADGATGVAMHRAWEGGPEAGEGTMALAARPAPGVEISACPAFDPAAEGAALWAGFAADGRLAALPGWQSGGAFAEHPAPVQMAALAARTTLAPGTAVTLDFALAWDLAHLRFGRGRLWARHHTIRWGTAGTNAAALAAHALARADAWSEAIDAFHADALARLDLPPPAAAAAINELYLIAAGSVWTAPGHGRPALFAPLECPDYPLFGTFDLWTYAAAAVDPLYPALADSLLDAFARDLPRDDPTPRRHLKSAARLPRKRAGWLAHDLGGPAGDPFVATNDYVYQDSSLWKDLGAMFVLECWRSARRGGAARAATLLAAVRAAMAALATADRDGDGLIENDGIPDQTFDNIPMHGVSAWCGGLWLAALRAAAALAELAGAAAAAAGWRATSARAEPAFLAALWTGSHFRLDSAGPWPEAVFAEQCHAPASARMLGLGDIVPEGHARRALATVMERNFRVAGGGRAAVLIAAPGPASPHAPNLAERGLQWDEALVGCNYALAAALRCYGMEDECRTLLAALAGELDRHGFTFRTPAAFTPAASTSAPALFRAAANLRPLGAFALAAARVQRNG